MKIWIDCDEWYPTYDFHVDGEPWIHSLPEIEVTPEWLEHAQNVRDLFYELQHELQDMYRSGHR